MPITIELPERASHTKFKLEHRLVCKDHLRAELGKQVWENPVWNSTREAPSGREIPATAVAKFPALSSKAKQEAGG